MSDNDIQIILRRIEEMSADHKHDLERINDKLDGLSRNGCSRSGVHAATSSDHEDRLRKVERYVDRQAGQVAVIGGGLGIFGGLLVTIGHALLKKVWG